MLAPPFENVGVDGARLWRAGCRPALKLRSIREGRGMVEGRGGCARSFFIRVCDDIDPADRLGGTLATNTSGEWFRIVQHVAESRCEEERAGRRQLVVGVASESVPKRGQEAD